MIADLSTAEIGEKLASVLGDSLQRSAEAQSWLQYFLGVQWRAHREAMGTGQCEPGCSTCAMILRAGASCGLELSGETLRLKCDRCKRPVSPPLPAGLEVSALLFCRRCADKELSGMEGLVREELARLAGKLPVANRMFQELLRFAQNPGRHSLQLSEIGAAWEKLWKREEPPADPAPAPTAADTQAAPSA